MDPVSAVDLHLALWGVLGAGANLGVVYLEASRRAKGWPWVRPHGPGGGVYAVSVAVHLSIAAVTTGAVSTAGIADSGLIAFGMGAAAPVVVKKLSRYVESLLPSAEEQKDRPAVDDGGDASSTGAGDQA